MKEINFLGQVILISFSRQLDLIYVNGLLNFTVENSLILNSRVVGKTDNLGNVRTKCAVLVLSNMYAAPLSISNSYSNAKFRKLIITNLQSIIGPKNALTRELMRQKVIKFLCNNIVFVGLHVGWTLAALQHRVSAEFVIDIFRKARLRNTHLQLGLYSEIYFNN